jgi:alanine-glyoxylate transaminase/serine-glyoxylate transaminase/serine-pyruvate transaminase
MKHRPGRHFLQVPGPSNVPDRILSAIHRPAIDHRGPEFAELSKDVLQACRSLFQTSGPVIIFPSSGSGGWEAALVNTLSPGDKVLMFETGHFAVLWHIMARKLGLDVEFLPGDWRHGVDPVQVEARLTADRKFAIKAVAVIHNETSSGVTSRLPEIRQAINNAGHPAMLLVDAISSLGCTEFKHDEWGVDVTICGSQKGLRLPPGLGFNVVSEKALAASRTSQMKRSYWDWNDMLQSNSAGFFPYTPATNLLYGLREALVMLQEEGLENVLARHRRHATATRAAVEAWGLEVVALDPSEYSNSVTAVMMPDGHDADLFRSITLEKYDLSLGMGLGKLKGRVFRIGHLGDLNDLMLMGALAGVEMGLCAAGAPYRPGGIHAAVEVLSKDSAESQKNTAVRPSGRRAKLSGGALPSDPPLSAPSYGS